MLTYSLRSSRRSLARLRTRSLIQRFEWLEQRTVFAAGQLDGTFGVSGTMRTEFDPTDTSGDTALATVVDSASRIVAAGERGLVRFLPSGVIDSSFGAQGRVAPPFYARALALQSDGKLVVAGGSAEFNSENMMLARYSSDGVIDTSFGSQGIVQIDLAGANEWATAVLIEPSGRIVVVGGAQSAMAVARLLPSGELDNSFSEDGRLVHQRNFSDTAYGLVRQPNGQLLVVGTSLITQGFQTNFDMSVTRINTNGTLDAAFGSRGMAYSNFTASSYSRDQGSGIALQADGKIVISGSAYGNFTSYTGVARLLGDGTLDPDFGIDGRTRVPVGSDFPTSNIVPLDNGSLLVSNYRGVFALNGEGVLDTSFDGDGIVIANGTVHALARQQDGAIVLAGFFLNGFAVKRLLADGSPDASFSSDSVAVAPLGPSNDTATHSALQSDGKIVVVGGGPRGFGIARYLSDGQLDSSFSADGLLVLSFGDQYFDGLATSVAIQSDGRIVVAGWLRQSGNLQSSSSIALARLHIDGSLDTSFSADGLLVSDLVGSADASSMLIQPDQKIVVAGTWNDRATLWRFNTDGTADTRFSGDGVVSMATDASQLSSIVLQPDGRILAAGSVRPSSFFNTMYSSILMLSRFNANGSLDATFGVKGKVVDPANQQRTADDIALLPDGSFVVVGDASYYRQGFESSQLAVTRYMPDGSLHGLFGTRLIEQVESASYSDFETFSTRAWGSALLRQPDGKFAVVGYSDTRMVIARMHEDGSPDSSFAGDGSTDVSLAGEALRATNVLLQGDGKLIVTGHVRSNSSGALQHDFYVARLTSANLPTYSTSVRLNAQGNLEIFDAWGRNDQLHFERTPDAIIVTDRSTDMKSRFRVIGLAGIVGDGTRQVTIPVSLVEGTNKPLLVNGMDGDDELTFESAFDAPRSGFVFRAGNGRDRMWIANSPVPVAWVMSTVHSGSARPQGRVPLNFTGVESLTGGAQIDSFRLVHQASSQLLRIDGGEGNFDSMELRADADMHFSRLALPAWGQRLIVDGVGQQLTALRNIESARLGGGAGNNTIDAREFNGSVSIFGAAGDDTLIGSRGPSTLNGDDGNDLLYGWQANDTLRGGRGDDLVVGYYGDDKLYGDDGVDILVGEFGADLLYGGNDDDLVIGAMSTALTLSSAAEQRDAILAVWRSADSTSVKIQKLALEGVGPGGAIKLKYGESILDDLAVDTFFGNAGTDWFAANSSTEVGVAAGGVRDRTADEQILTA